MISFVVLQLLLVLLEPQQKRQLWQQENRRENNQSSDTQQLRRRLTSQKRISPAARQPSSPAAHPQQRHLETNKKATGATFTAILSEAFVHTYIQRYTHTHIFYIYPCVCISDNSILIHIDTYTFMNRRKYISIQTSVCICTLLYITTVESLFCVPLTRDLGEGAWARGRHETEERQFKNHQLQTKLQKRNPTRIC